MMALQYVLSCCIVRIKLTE